jgi:putative endonuclease
MTKARQALGAAGEARAAAWYERRGYEVVARNWRCRDGELDLVVCKGRVLAFVEVKTRRTAAFGAPVEAITRDKQRRIRVLALRFLEVHPGRGRELRFDVVSILGDELTVLEGAF